MLTEQLVTVNFSLRRGVSVTGSVGTRSGLRPGVTVAAYNLTGTRRGFTTTGLNGNYSLVLAPGTFKLVAYDDAGAFVPEFFRAQATFDDADPVTVELGRAIPSIDFFLEPGRAFRASPLTSGGAPLPNVSVLAYSSDGKYLPSSLSDSDGHFAMTLAPGSYRFVAIDGSFTFAAAFPGGATSSNALPSSL